MLPTNATPTTTTTQTSATTSKLSESERIQLWQQTLAAQGVFEQRVYGQ